MPEINLPEVKLPKFELPEGLRDMTREDIQKAMPEIRLPNLQKQAERVAENAGRFAGDVGRNIDNALPRRPGPSPVPFAVLGMIGGLVVGWILATSPATQPRIAGFMDWIRARIGDWRNRGMTEFDDEFETGTDAFRTQATDIGDLGISTGGGAAYAGAESSTMHTDSGADAWSDSRFGEDTIAGSGAGTTADTNGFGLRTGGGVGSETEDTKDDEPADSLTGDFRGQSLGAASADDLESNANLDADRHAASDVPDAVVVDEVVVVSPSTGSPGVGTSDDTVVQDDGRAEGTGRMTDQMQIDDTEDDDAPATGRV
jgi:hypothetical protein